MLRRADVMDLGPANSGGLRNVRRADQLVMAAILDDAAMLERNDPIGCTIESR